MILSLVFSFSLFQIHYETLRDHAPKQKTKIKFEPRMKYLNL